MPVESVRLRMAINGTVRKREDVEPSERRFVAACDDCPFEEEIYGVDAAREAAADHKRVTEHDVVALEFPAKQ